MSGTFVAGTCANSGTYTNTWTANDVCNNTSTVFTQVITIQDTSAPAWTTTAGSLNVTLECSDTAGLTASTKSGSCCYRQLRRNCNLYKSERNFRRWNLCQFWNLHQHLDR
ncbi:hypothetical protein ACQ9BO_20535 [Flavobacterium sp. P21]|uniref:hypothetical protein n=1 Tax=Flavobacterium sp. P21 TaxID=3423948 RepID=UPI003D66F00E